jgi:hypothetical protein
MSRCAFLIILSTICYHIATAAAHDTHFTFDTCKQNVLAIINGTYSQGDINNQTIWQYIYTGPVRGLKADFPRADFLTLTLSGTVKFRSYGH